MSDRTIGLGALNPSQNIEDRRNEFNAWQHLLMSMGIPPINSTDHVKAGWPNGTFDNADLPVPEGPPSPLMSAAGFLDLDQQQELWKQEKARRLAAYEEKVQRTGTFSQPDEEYK